MEITETVDRSLFNTFPAIQVRNIDFCDSFSACDLFLPLQVNVRTAKITIHWFFRCAQGLVFHEFLN
jgi:hypothetical protein